MTKLTLLFKMLNTDQLDNHLPWKIMCCPMLKRDLYQVFGKTQVYINWCIPTFSSFLNACLEDTDA